MTMLILRNSQQKDKRSLDDIFGESDDLGLLNVEPLKTRGSSSTQLQQQFEELNEFVSQHERWPSGTSNDLNEKILARRLDSLQRDSKHHQELRPLDVHGLLYGAPDVQASGGDYKVGEPKPEPYHGGVVEPVSKAELVTSLEDIFDDDDDDLLSFDDDSIFNMQYVSRETKAKPEEIAQRRPCVDFERFAPLFKEVHQQLRAGEAEKIRFKHELKIAVGEVFTLYGVMCYVNSVGEQIDSYDSYNARLHLIFENGTELNMLYQSLGAGLIRDKDGSKVMLNGLKLKPEPPAQSKGMVYIVTPVSKPAALSGVRDLYKIGYTDTTVEERVRNAEKDKTFLETPMRIVTAFECYNINPQKLENLVHGFLATQRVGIKLMGKDGNYYQPREWFAVSFVTAQSVIEHILDGTISQYRMDNTTGRIVKK